MVAVRGTDHAGPRKFDAQVAADVVALQFLPVFVDKHWLDAGERKHGKTGDGGRDARNGRDKDTAVFGLPPRVDDGRFPLPYFFVIPIPSLLIDGLPHAAQLADASEVFVLAVLQLGRASCRERVCRYVEI